MVQATVNHKHEVGFILLLISRLLLPCLNHARLCSNIKERCIVGDKGFWWERLLCESLSGTLELCYSVLEIQKVSNF